MIIAISSSTIVVSKVDDVFCLKSLIPSLALTSNPRKVSILVSLATRVRFIFEGIQSPHIRGQTSYCLLLSFSS